MINKIIVTFCLICSVATFAQDGTASPYSFYGIGEVKFSGTAENRSMGGLSIFRDSIHMNIQNPASYSSMKLTSFAIGGNTNTTVTNSATAEDKSKRTTLDYLVVGLPFGKFGASFGLVPYSSIGYKTQLITEAVGSYPRTLDRHSGSGGINRVYAGLAYNISKNLSIGANINYNFGKINTDDIQYRDPDVVQYGTKENNLSNVKGINFSTGLMFEKNLKGGKVFTTSLTFTPQSNLTFDTERTISIVQIAVAGESIVQSLDKLYSETKVISPSKFTFGAGYGQSKKWQIGAEMVYQQNSKLTNRFNDNIPNVSFENATKYIVGGYFIPKYNSFTSYFQRVVYRVGFNFQNTGLIINNQSIKDQSISIGLGLPLNGTFSNINIGLEMGKKGTTNAGLIQENYTNISIGLSFNDRWFIKRKYD
jgi:hypothetical protein